MWKDVDPYIREEMELRDWVTWTPETSEVNGRSVLSWISCEFRKLAEATMQAVNPETGLSGYDACTRKYGSSTPRPASTSSTLVMSKWDHPPRDGPYWVPSSITPNDHQGLSEMDSVRVGTASVRMVN